MTVLAEHTAGILREAIDPLPGMLDRMVDLLKDMQTSDTLHLVDHGTADEMRSLVEGIVRQVSEVTACVAGA